MHTRIFVAAVLAALSFGLVRATGQEVVGQELNAEGKSKEVAEARAKRNAQNFKNNASFLTFLDRYGKQTGQVGERSLYWEAYLSPDGKSIATIKPDQENESGDLFVLNIATGVSIRLTTSARTEWVQAPLWSPDSQRLAYVTIRKGKEAIYVRAANGEGDEEVIYRNQGAFLNLSSWSRDGKFLAYSVSDLKGGSLYILPLAGDAADRKPSEIYHTDLRLWGAAFSPDGRYLSYVVADKANKRELFVRSVDPAAKEGPWQISDGTSGVGFWRGDKLYYGALDRSIMAAEVKTSPSFSFAKPAVFFRQPVTLPDWVWDISADAERFLVVPPGRGHELQQITIFDRKGEVVKKVGAPAAYGQPTFSPSGDRLLVTKNDLVTSQRDFWVMDIATGKATQITNDNRFKRSALWSPDGKYIYYPAFLDGDWPVYRLAMDGTGKEELIFRYTLGAFVDVTDITPDGKFIIVESGGVIMLVPLGGNDPAARKETEYLRDEFFENGTRLSPDGRFFAYRSDEAKPERMEVYVRPFDATKPVSDQKWQISKDGGGGMLQWRADGREIFFRGQNLDSNDLLMMSAEVQPTPEFRVEPPRLLFRLPGPIGGGSVSRDGQQFALAVNVKVDEVAAAPASQ